MKYLLHLFLLQETYITKIAVYKINKLVYQLQPDNSKFL